MQRKDFTKLIESAKNENGITSLTIEETKLKFSQLSDEEHHTLWTQIQTAGITKVVLVGGKFDLFSAEEIQRFWNDLKFSGITDLELHYSNLSPLSPDKWLMTLRGINHSSLQRCMVEEGLLAEVQKNQIAAAVTKENKYFAENEELLEKLGKHLAIFDKLTVIEYRQSLYQCWQLCLAKQKTKDISIPKELNDVINFLDTLTASDQKKCLNILADKIYFSVFNFDYLNKRNLPGEPVAILAWCYHQQLAGNTREINLSHTGSLALTPQAIDAFFSCIHFFEIKELNLAGLFLGLKSENFQNICAHIEKSGLSSLDISLNTLREDVSDSILKMADNSRLTVIKLRAELSNFSENQLQSELISKVEAILTKRNDLLSSTTAVPLAVTQTWNTVPQQPQKSEPEVKSGYRLGGGL